MIFYGLLRQLVTRWLGDADAALQNDLIGGQGGIVSAEPAVRLQRLAVHAADDPVLVERLKGGAVGGDPGGSGLPAGASRRSTARISNASASAL